MLNEQEGVHVSAARDAVPAITARHCWHVTEYGHGAPCRYSPPRYDRGDGSSCKGCMTWLLTECAIADAAETVDAWPEGLHVED